MEYGERERDFQLYRRGRDVEFNLVWIAAPCSVCQSGGRTRIHPDVLPRCEWRYAWQPDRGHRRGGACTAIFCRRVTGLEEHDTA